MRKEKQSVTTAIAHELSNKDLDIVAGGGSTVGSGVTTSADVEQVLNIGSQSSGAGAGKVTFNPFQITRK